MGPKYQALKGMEDLLPGEVEKWQWLEGKARIFLEAQGYKEIRTPLMEPAELFQRSLGEASDIVHKEMYQFEDRGGRQIALRPEMTASVARAVIENHLLKQTGSLRLYYLGAMFRGERPQAGRRRQFHQIGIERVNAGGAPADGEVISILWRLLAYWGLKGAELRLNYLGCAKDRPALLASLKEYFLKRKEKLCADCNYRLEKNVLRIFDCKNEACQPVVREAPWKDFCADCRKDFDGIQDLLRQEHRIPFKLHQRLVRGIDYYTGAVFEVVAQGLGAQDAVAGGGRYDGLYESLGGGSVPATGFSVGMERLFAALGEQDKDFFRSLDTRRVYIASLVTRAEDREFLEKQILLLRESGIVVEVACGETSLSAHLKRANQLGVRLVLICGEDEMKTKQFSLKDLEAHRQEKVAFSDTVAALRKLF